VLREQYKERYATAMDGGEAARPPASAGA